MAKFKVSAEKIKEAELYKTVVSSPIWLGVIVSEYKKDKDSKGADLHKYQLKVQQVDNPENDQYKGMTLFTQFSEKNLGFMGPFCAATGCPSDGEGGFEFDSFDAFKGKRLDAYVVPAINKETKKQQNQIEDFRPWSWSDSAQG